jgi:hypothetical protein
LSAAHWLANSQNNIFFQHGAMTADGPHKQRAQPEAGSPATASAKTVAKLSNETDMPGAASISNPDESRGYISLGQGMSP